MSPLHPDARTLLPPPSPGVAPRGRRPHVLFIVENSTVPGDPRVWREACFARDRGWHVSVVAPLAADCPLRYEVMDGIEVHRHPLLERGSGAWAQLLEYASAMVCETALSLKIYRRRPFQVIHGANPPDHLFLIALLFRPFGVRFVFDHHDLAPELYLSKYGGRRTPFFHALRWMERLSCRTAHAVISTNESYRRHVTAVHAIDPRKVFVVRNDPEVGREPTLVSARTSGAQPCLRLLYLGSINTQDGVDLLIRSLHVLVDTLGERGFRCDILGDGDDLPRVRRLSSGLGLDPYVRFLGYVSDRKVVRSHLRAADICVESAPLNEVNAKSTFIKIMEYMAAAKPIVAFDLPETRTSAGEAAVLVPPNDTAELARAVQALMRDPRRRSELGRLGRDRIVSRLNWGRAAESLANVYANLIPPERREDHPR